MNLKEAKIKGSVLRWMGRGFHLIKSLSKASEETLMRLSEKRCAAKKVVKGSKYAELDASESEEGGGASLSRAQQ